MNPDNFAKIANSLRQYRRAELRDFEYDIGEHPVDQLYVDPLPGQAILNSVTSSNTTFLLGRKGTGKSTVFARAQSELSRRKDVISIYVDVKSLTDSLTISHAVDDFKGIEGISSENYYAHILRKKTLGAIVSELLKSINETCDKITLWQSWLGKKKQYEELRDQMELLSVKVASSNLESQEIPILQRITRSQRTKQGSEVSNATELDGKGSANLDTTGPSLNVGGGSSISDFNKTLDDVEIYNEYSDVVLKSFPFAEIIEEIKTLLAETGLTRMVMFFDDFSELDLLDQKLFVDVILSPLNNSSNEAIKLKVAGYPGRVYYGRIDPGKTDTIEIDFSDLYEANEVQEMESSAVDYTTRLLKKRFEVFGENFSDYFDLTSSSTEDVFFRLIFQSSFNVPRIVGYILHTCYLDRISKGLKITQASIKLSSRKYYENTVAKYFDRSTRYALEPFENKLDRHNQKQLLDALVMLARGTRKRIIDGEVGGTYFTNVSNPPTSHFIVSPDLESAFAALESNFLLSRYKKTRDKDSQDVIVYALYMGLCEKERMIWGYPDGREFRNYFTQRCFDYTRPVYQYLSESQTIKCGDCSHCYSLDLQPSIEMYDWKCPQCKEGTCAVVNISDDFLQEFNLLDKEIMLEAVELEILTTLNEEERDMRASDISSLIDTTYQMVGKRTSKLKDLGLVDKRRDSQQITRSEITPLGKDTYFKNDKSDE